MPFHKLTLLLCLSAFALPCQYGFAEVSVYQQSSKTVIKDSTGRLAFSNATGFGVALETLLAAYIPARVSYEVTLSGSNVLLHGPSAQLGWMILGGRNKMMQQDEVKIAIKYPFALQVFAGVFAKFHNFSPLQTDEQRAFSSAGRISKAGVLSGTSAHVQLDIPLTPIIGCYFGVGGVYAAAPTIDISTRITSYEVKLGAQFAW